MVLNENFTEILNEYLTWEELNTTKQGLESLKKRIRVFLFYLQENGIQIHEVNSKIAKSFISSLRNRKNCYGKKISNGTICNYLKACKRFYKFQIIMNKVESNPFSNIKYPKVPKKITNNFLTSSNMIILLDYMENFQNIKSIKSKAKHYLFHVLSEVLYSTGARISEINSIQSEDIDFEKKRILIKKSKNGNSRYVYLTERVIPVLQEYVKNGRSWVIKKMFQDNRDDFFCYKSNILMLGFNDFLCKTCKNLKLNKISSHGFRHSLGTHLLQSGLDLRYIQSILGHLKLSSTEYYTHICNDDLEKCVQKYHPRKFIKLRNYDEKQVAKLYY